MKKLFIIMSVFVATTAQAQQTDTPMATLQHGDQTQVFIGQEAFAQAVSAAADSADVITLSSGYFKSPGTIYKSVSVYGAGMEDDSITGIKATVISSHLSFQPGDKTDDDGNTQKGAVHVNGVHLEGLDFGSYEIYFNNLNNIPMQGFTIVKCKFDALGFYAPCKDLAVRQCKFGNISYAGSKVSFSNVLVSNSHFSLLYLPSDSLSKNVQIDHCVATNTGNVIYNVALVTNSILYGSLYTGSTARNNIFLGSTGSNIQDLDTNWTGLKNAGVWAADGEDGSYSSSKSFELKYPAKYVGTDGTEVGLHGGLYPWNKIPCTPRITKSEIDATTSVDGKLKVSITAEAQTKE